MKTEFFFLSRIQDHLDLLNETDQSGHMVLCFFIPNGYADKNPRLNEDV